MKPITKRYVIHAPVADVWDALVNPKTIRAWGGGPVKMHVHQGKWWHLWGGDICGRNLEVVKGKKLAQEWYGGDWDEGSKVTFSLKPTKTGTILSLRQTGVPKEEYADIRDGWDDYYLGPIKELLEERVVAAAAKAAKKKKPLKKNGAKKRR
jgi:activator of HSP90 ATPase